VTVTDPRTSIIGERMKDINKIVAVSSGKGGVGKSLIASTLALTLAQKGFRVGLFDLDFTSPSTHIILGIEDVHPKEEKGIIPPEVHGVKYMSIVYYSRDHAVPLRGFDVSNVLIELLSITRWGKLDYLILDMPPGIGDVTLDLIRLIKNTQFLIVTTPSKLAFETVKKLVSLLETMKTQVIGVVENMKMHDSNEIRRETEKLNLKFLIGIPYDSRVELAMGDVHKLLKTTFAERVEKLSSET
jgi:ATP-binding protein involved in chromosome partitioning